MCRGQRETFSKFCSKSCGPDKKEIECYWCHKKGHMKKDCPKWKAEKGKDKEESHNSNGSNVKIEEINVACIDEDGDILFTLILDPSLLITSDGNDFSDWLND